MNPTIFVVLGATGDLMEKKIAPALWELFKKNELPETFELIGFSRQDFSDDDYRNWLRERLTKNNQDLQNLDSFLAKCSYFHGDLGNFSDFKKLGERLSVFDGKISSCSNKNFYLAIPPDKYQTTIDHLAKSGLTQSCSEEEGWTRVLIEKPFGNDLKTAQELDRQLAKLFQEKQIYRIDHYLAKEMVQDILTFRFSNNLFESVWNSKNIEKIEIKLWESIDVKDRGKFYDGVGALKDVGQNHALQMLALLLMKNPTTLTSENVREKRAEALENVLPPQDINTQTYRAQYNGYKNTEGVNPNSTTETYFKIQLRSKDPEWKDTPITIEAGKALHEIKKEAIVTFKHPSPCLCPTDPGHHMHNTIRISLEPEEHIVADLWAKKPGLEFEIEKRSMEFLLRDSDQKEQYSEEYQRLLYDSLTGDQTLFASSAEVKAMWSVIDPIINSWDTGKPQLNFYDHGSDQAIKASINLDVLPTQITSKQTKPHQIGIVGLGKMGTNLAKRAMQQGWKVSGYNRSIEDAQALEKDGLQVAKNLAELKSQLNAQRIIWLMLPAGKAIDAVLFGENGELGLMDLLDSGDIVIDGGNSFYKDSIRRYETLKEKGITLVDIGVSGGPEGTLTGPCLMIGGEKKIYQQLKHLFIDLSQNNSYAFFAGVGMGHFVKMVHNAIEYGMMQAIAEGFELLKTSPSKIDLQMATQIYNNRSVIESKLIGWLGEAYLEYGPDLTAVSSKVGHLGEGEWALKVGQELGLEMKTINEAFQFRLDSGKKPRYAGKVVSALRGEFGGHEVEKE